MSTTVDPIIVARRRQLADGLARAGIKTRRALARELGVTERTLSAALSERPGRTNAKLYELAIIGLYYDFGMRPPRADAPGGPFHEPRPAA